MAKTIKFNLICDGKPIRTIEDLQNNFSVEDVLEYYNNKLLHRWLNVRGYSAELETVNKITAQNPIDIIKELISIFNIEEDERSISERVYMLEYLEERKEVYNIYKDEGYKVASIIEDYQTGYKQLIDRIIDNPDDISIIKSAILEIMDNYFWIFVLDHRRLFYFFLTEAPLAILLLLSNSKSRNFFLPIKLQAENNKPMGIEIVEPSFESFLDDDSSIIDINLPENRDKRYMYNAICDLTFEQKLSEILKDNLKSFAGITDSYWKDLEPKGKKYMILGMGNGDFVRASNVSGGDLGYEDVKNKFVIVDGIDYKSNSSIRKLLYMEV